MISPLAQVTLGMLGGSAATYIAGGAEITVSRAAAHIDIAPGDGLDIQIGGITIDVVTAGKALVIDDDRYTIHL